MRIARLGDVCAIQSGGTPSRKKDEFWNGNIPWAKISDIENSNNGEIIETEEQITSEGLSSIRNRIFNKGTLLFAIYGSVGKTAFVGRTMAVNQAILGIKPYDNRIDIRYLYYWMAYKKNSFLDMARGVALKNLSATIVRDLKIPLPPLHIQKKIAEVLDKADAIRKRNELILQKYDQLAESVFLEMFGDPMKNEKGWIKVETKNINLTIKKIDKKCFDEYIDYIDISSINNEKNIITTSTRFKLNDRPSRAQQVLTYGDILFSTVRPNLKNIAINHSNNKIGSTGFFIFRPNSKILNNVFLFSLLKTKSVTNHFIGLTAGANYPALRNADINKFRIIAPPIESQIKFSISIKKLEDLKSHQDQELKKCEELFQSLLQKAFNGELFQQELRELN